MMGNPNNEENCCANIMQITSDAESMLKYGIDTYQIFFINVEKRF